MFSTTHKDSTSYLVPAIRMAPKVQYYLYGKLISHMHPYLSLFFFFTNTHKNSSSFSAPPIRTVLFFFSSTTPMVALQDSFLSLKPPITCLGLFFRTTHKDSYLFFGTIHRDGSYLFLAPFILLFSTTTMGSS